MPSISRTCLTTIFLISVPGTLQDGLATFAGNESAVLNVPFFPPVQFPDQHLPALLDFLCTAVAARCNILISGSTGAGKTTLLNILSRYIDEHQRIVTIEDAAELQLGHSHVVRLETRLPNMEGEGQVTARELVRNVLRMRPDRIILGEIRSVEVLDMLQAMNTGHEGSMSTIHANSARDALSRLGMLAGMAGFTGTEITLKETISSAIDLIVHVTRLPDGQRKIVHIQELVGVQDGHYSTHELFGYDAKNNHFVRTMIQPQSEKLQQMAERPMNARPYSL